MGVMQNEQAEKKGILRRKRMCEGKKIQKGMMGGALAI